MSVWSARAYTIRCMAVCIRLSVCRFMWWEETHSHIFFTFEWDSLNLCVDKRKPDLCDQIELKMSSQHFPFSRPSSFVIVALPHMHRTHISMKLFSLSLRVFDCVDAKGFFTDRQIRFWLLIFPILLSSTGTRLINFGALTLSHTHTGDTLTLTELIGISKPPTDSIMPHER